MLWPGALEDVDVLLVVDLLEDDHVVVIRALARLDVEDVIN